MEVDVLKQLSYRELQRVYTNYLIGKNFSSKTINTYKNDAFYLLNHDKTIDFWKLVVSDDFEEEARNHLLSALEKYSSGNIKTNINSYMATLRLFRKFVLCQTDIDVNQNSQNMYKDDKQEVRLPTPCEDAIRMYLQSWDSLESYRTQEAALNKLFLEYAPNNTKIEDILLKTATLNTFYSTNIYSIYPVAQHILSLQIDERLISGDITLVDDIMHVSDSRNYYSFATKYCSHHNLTAYPIYDSYIDRVLRQFRDQDNFYIFQNSELKNYIQFKQILLKFQTYYGLENYSIKAIDKYLWQLGKQYYHRTY